MSPRRVLLRIKKLRRFLDERIRTWTGRLEGASDLGERMRARGRVEAYQDVREEMVGEPLPAAAEEGGADRGADREQPAHSDGAEPVVREGAGA